jgi:hypothetical protein
VLRRRFDLRRADLRKCEVAEGAASVPALVPLLREQLLRLRDRIDSLCFQPLDPGETVTSLAASLGIEEVVGERLRLALGEAEGAQPGQGVLCPQSL